MQDIACVAITLSVSVMIMIEQKKDAPNNPPYWVCTNCKWAFEALQAANRHRCGNQEMEDNGQRFYSKKILSN